MTWDTKIIKTIHFLWLMLGIWSVSFDGADFYLPVNWMFKLKIELHAMLKSAVILKRRSLLKKTHLIDIKICLNIDKNWFLNKKFFGLLNNVR